MSERVTASELARRLGVTEGSVRKHLKTGMYRRGRDRLIDFDAARVSFDATRDPDAAIKGQLGGEAVAKSDDGGVRAPVETTLTRARTAQAILKGQREQLALSKAKGELISKADAMTACRAVISIANERLDGVAAQAAPRVAGMANVAEIERIIREAVNSARTEIAGLGKAIEVAGETRS